MHNLIRHIVKALTTLCLLLINIPIYPISYSFRILLRKALADNANAFPFYPILIHWLKLRSSFLQEYHRHLLHLPENYMLS